MPTHKLIISLFTVINDLLSGIEKHPLATLHPNERDAVVAWTWMSANLSDQELRDVGGRVASGTDRRLGLHRVPGAGG